MVELALNFLGDLEVIREGEVVPLPPSKKTRALLAYLALSERAFRREHLCELLWEIPDDPRGSLRWSLSKLRRVVDEGESKRIMADRTNVRMETSGVVIDLISLRELVSGDLSQTPVQTLEAAAQRYRGNFLEGLELPNFHDFHTWCIAEREAAVRAQATLLEHLLVRLAGDPQRALPYARALVGISPYDESARAALVGLLVRLQCPEEAQQQVRLGERMLAEIGLTSDGSLLKAWRGKLTGQSVETVPPRVLDVQAAPVVDESRLLVGRESECARIGTVFSQVSHEGRCEVLLLNGEPGIGKSRLLEWAAGLANTAGSLLLEASAFEYEAIRPYALWLDALRRHDAVEEVFAGDDHDNRDRLFAGLSAYVSRQADTRPVVVLFDDVQWADESSMAALHYVVRMCRSRPLLVLLGGRAGELQDNAALQHALRGLRHDAMLKELKLGPLSEAAIRDLIASRAPEADADELCRECGGNPLLAIELARAGSEGEQGGSLDELVRERLGRFDVDGVEVLCWAAVLSPRINLPSLVHVTGQDSNRVGAALELAERQALLRPADHGFRFSHDLIAGSVYAQIAPARRQIMHRRAADLIERDATLDLEHAADLAHHALASGDLALGARAMVSAGKLCLRFFANDDALVLARRGLQLAGRLTGAEQVCRRIELFDVMLTAAPVYEWEAAAREYASLAEQALDHGELSHARLGYHMASYVRWINGHWSGAREQTLQAELVTRGASAAEHVVGMAEAAKCLVMLERDLSQADAMLMEAKAAAARDGSSYHALPMAEGMLCYHEGKWAEGVRLLQEARTLCRLAGDRISEYQALEHLVMMELEQGHPDAARSLNRGLVELGGKIREGSEGPFARALDGVCGYAQGDPDDALNGALEELRVADAKHRLAYALNRAADIDLQAGRWALAVERADEALGYAEILQRNTEMLMARSVLAQGLEACGDRPGAEAQRDAASILLAEPVARWARQRAQAMLGIAEETR
jgi:DNA-binding SARP family transcriptional activator